jgi:hypothetical protein
MVQYVGKTAGTLKGLSGELVSIERYSFEDVPMDVIFLIYATPIE